MKQLIIFSFLYLLSFNHLFGQEGIVSVNKIENGIESNFAFYVKEGKIALISEDGAAYYQLILSAAKNELILCIDHPSFQKKGYYLYNKTGFIKNDSLTILSEKSVQKDALSGYSVSTTSGVATVFFGNQNVSLNGFSTFMNDPVYEAIDRSGYTTLPVLIVTDSAKYTLVFEEMPVDNKHFQIPDGYEQFEVRLAQ